jgi:hypothetical protein
MGEVVKHAATVGTELSAGLNLDFFPDEVHGDTADITTLPVLLAGLRECPATRRVGMSASRWVGMRGAGEGPADGAGGAWWCPGCRGGGLVVVVSRWRG